MNNEECPPTKPLGFPGPFDGGGSILPAGRVIPPAGDGIDVDRLPPVLRASKRFELCRLLGRGTFGEVYLAHDRQLSRQVALKVPRADKLRASDDLESFLREARVAASLRHPGIVIVYDVHGDSDGVYIVLEFIEGCTLADYAAHEHLPLNDTVRLMVEISQAVAFAHKHGLVHRDLKPSNILVDAGRSIRITDFGLAIHERRRQTMPRDTAGTPFYMAPEQVRGETHRLDGRTDVWSLGVIFYWLLTRRRVFDGTNEIEVFDEILHSEPRPPRQIFPELPREIERICLKCLARRMSDRYATAHDLADDLLHWLERTSSNDFNIPAGAAELSDPSQTGSNLPVIPKGLRSFDQHDSDFYLCLLPGPYDREGLPEGVRFWKQRVESRDPAETFAVGLMYGPSGCGKTSLVRAGILPRLTTNVRWVYAEVSPHDVERQLQGAIARTLPELPMGLSLVETLVALREGQYLRRDEKLLIVLDQFEQSLDGRETEIDNPLVVALRQCDGVHLQCLLMVRDDFSMAATRFMNALEIPISEGHNCIAVDVFRRDHAERVLRRFGEAFGRLSETSPGDSQRFIEHAVDLLSEGNVVAPVRLAAFAELTRHQDWNAATLRGMGGRDGLGVALLETYLGEDTPHVTHRQHRAAARRVLEALLPSDRTSLKGPMRSRAELMEAAGYSDRPRDFETLVNILDKELRLISPADPAHGVCEAASFEAEGSTRRERYYQLAHDYLVPSLITWLTSKQRETRAGRASLLLETISSDWNARPDVRRLPTILEWASIRGWTHSGHWTPPQRLMMAAAQRRLFARAGMVVLLAVLAGAAFLVAQRREQRRWREQQGLAAAQQLLVADISRVPDLLQELDSIASPAIEDLLQQVSVSRDRSNEERLRAELFLAPSHEAVRKSLLQKLLTLGPAEHHIITARLAADSPALTPLLWNEVERTRSDERLLRAAGALARLDPGNAAWSAKGARVADALARCANPYHLPSWVEALIPVHQALTPQLALRFRDRTSSGTERTPAVALVHFLSKDLPALVPLAVDASPESFPLFLTALEGEPDLALEKLREFWSLEDLPLQPRLRAVAVGHRAVAAISLARLGSDQELRAALEGDASPDVRTAVIGRCASYGLAPQHLFDIFDHGAAPLERQAILIALAEYGARLSSETKAELIARCRQVFIEDSDAGAHAGAEYALRRLGAADELARLRTELAAHARGTKDWWINRSGITMVVVQGPLEFMQGAPDSEIERDKSEVRKLVRLPYSFAVSSHEITVEQFRQYQPEYAHAKVVTPTGEWECPASNVAWLDAVKFCRRLSEAEGIDEQQMCYPPIDQLDENFQLPEDWQRRTGYRLPTESEWEYFCRAGTTTARFYGEAADLLNRYAVFNANSQDRLWPAGSFRPNPWGLFDVYGNVLEWCQDETSPIDFGPPVEGGPVHRMLRSGSYRSVERENRSAKRTKYDPSSKFAFLGLRVVKTIRDVSPDK